MSRPNIVWIFPDEWRHDAAGFAGNSIVQTPHLDALAARGVVFTNAQCESPVCQSGRASLLTAQYPARHGLSDNEHLGGHRDTGVFPAADAPNFLHALRDAGYRTAEIGKMHFGRGSVGEGVRAWGFDDSRQEHDKYVLWRLDTPYTRHLKEQGLFDAWAAHNSSLLPFIPTPDGRMEPNPRFNANKKAEPDVVPAEETLDTFIGNGACDYIRRYEGTDPFFLWVAPIGPHSPFDAAPVYRDRYDPADIPIATPGVDEYPENRWGEYLAWNRRHVGCSRWTVDDYRQIGAYYYGLITQIDDAVGRIVDTLAATGRDRDTWIVISSDHGELLGDHGLISKRVFYRTSVGVPQVIVPPVGTDIGGRVDGYTQAFDIVGTILDLAGATPREPVAAQSLLPVLSGDDVTRDIVYSEIAGFLMVATAEHKLVIHEETLEVGALYDLTDDPDERRNLVDEPAAKAVAEDMVDLAVAFLREQRPGEVGATASS